MGVREYLEGFHRGCVDYLSRKFVPKRDRPNGESVLTKAGATFLLVELIGVGAKPLAGWMCQGGLRGEFQKTMGDLEHGY